MRGGNLLGWVLLCVWGAWLAALSGHWLQFSWAGRAAPDLWTALFLALGVRMPPADLARLAVALGPTPAAASIEPPAVSLAAALALGGLLRAARSAVQLDNGVVTGLFAFAAVLGLGAWSRFVHTTTHSAALGAIPAQFEPSLPWGAACTTAVVAVVCGGLFTRLPGVAPLSRRKTWAVGASYR